MLPGSPQRAVQRHHHREAQGEGQRAQAGAGGVPGLGDELRHHHVDHGPGGCSGGGGQPIHEGEELADTRGKVLWNLDKASAIRYSHENPDVVALYREYMEKPLSEKAHHLLHTNQVDWTL